MYRMKHIHRRILSLLLSAVLLLGVLPGMSLAADKAAKHEDKYEARLIEAIQNASDTDRIPVWIWRTSFASGYIDALVESEYGREPPEGSTLAEFQAYTQARRQICRREYTANNEQFIRDVLPECPRENFKYVGKYTSTIIASLTKAEIAAAAADGSVEDLSLYKDEEAEAAAAGENAGPDYANIEELHRQICADFYATYQDPSFPLEDVYIERDCGEYDGCRIVVMGIRSLPMTDDMLYLNVGGYVFTFSSGSYRGLFLAYCDGVFVPMAEAFDKGLLSRKSVRALFDSLKRYRPDFTDVAWNAWYYTAVSDACACRLFNGVGGKRFDPEGDMTRAMLVTVLWRNNGSPLRGSQTGFTDVRPDAWYAWAVGWAVENKIVEGVGDGRFAPDAPVTREQFVTILHRLNGKPEPAETVDESKFADFAEVSGWAKDALRWAVSIGIVEGSKQGEGTLLLNPGASATRAQAAALLMRYIDSLPDHVGEQPDPLSDTAAEIPE